MNTRVKFQDWAKNKKYDTIGMAQKGIPVDFAVVFETMLYEAYSYGAEISFEKMEKDTAEWETILKKEIVEKLSVIFDGLKNSLPAETETKEPDYPEDTENVEVTKDVINFLDRLAKKDKKG